jgi:hypothetical protein
MNENQLIIQPLNIVLFIVGLGAGIFFAVQYAPVSIGLGVVFDLIVISVAVFLLSIIFNGYLSPLVFLYLGLVNSKLILSNPIGVIGYLIPLVIASYAGGIAANYASMDMNGEGNFFQHWKVIAGLLVLAVVAATIWAVVMGFLPSFQDLNAIFSP